MQPADLSLTDRDSDSDVDGDDLDQLIAELNEQASSTIDEYTDRTFTETTETIAIDGNGRYSIRLPGYPVQSIDSVTVGDRTLGSDEYRVKPSQARDGHNSGILERKGAVWPDGWENVEITYTWGYTTPPGTVTSVAEELVVDALRAAAANEKGAKSGVQSYSLDGYSVSFSESLTSTVGTLSPEQKGQLDDLKRVAIA